MKLNASHYAKIDMSSQNPAQPDPGKFPVPSRGITAAREREWELGASRHAGSGPESVNFPDSLDSGIPCTPTTGSW
jgi:hypothetical protein